MSLKIIDVFHISVTRAGTDTPFQLYIIYLMRSKLIKKVLLGLTMELSGIKTKKETVELALMEFVQRRTQKNLAELQQETRQQLDRKTRQGHLY